MASSFYNFFPLLELATPRHLQAELKSGSTLLLSQLLLNSVKKQNV